MFLPLRQIVITRPETGRQIVYTMICDIEIIKSVESLTRTATITIPRKLIYKASNQITLTNQTVPDYVDIPATGDYENTSYTVGADALFKRGDKIDIYNGFWNASDNFLQKRFSGYISKVISTLPIKIQCEDEMWVLKQSNCVYPDPSTYVYSKKRKHTYISTKVNSTLKQFLDALLAFIPAERRPKYFTVDDNMDLGKIIVDNVSVASCLQVYLKDRFGLFSKFRDDGILYVGFANNFQQSPIQELVMEDVVLNNDTLEWVNATDINIKIKGISINTVTNARIEYEAFYLNGVITGKFNTSESQAVSKFDGNTITQITTNQTKDGLKLFIDNRLKALNYSGFRGDVITLGEPPVQPGDILKLTSRKLPERNGKYLIKAVKILDGTEGYFQHITLGERVNVTS